jgi:hypothetical protein
MRRLIRTRGVELRKISAGVIGPLELVADGYDDVLSELIASFVEGLELWGGRVVEAAPELLKLGVESWVADC